MSYLDHLQRNEEETVEDGGKDGLSDFVHRLAGGILIGRRRQEGHSAVP